MCNKEYVWRHDNLYFNGILVGGIRQHESENAWYWVTYGVYMLGIPNSDTYETPVTSVQKAKVRCSRYVKDCVRRSERINAPTSSERHSR